MQLILDGTTKKITAILGGAITTNYPEFTAAWADMTTSSLTPGSSAAAFSSTSETDIVASPGASTQRIIKNLCFYNKDTVATTITIKYYNGTSYFIIAKVTLAAGDTWTTDGTFDANGNLKTTNTFPAGTQVDGQALSAGSNVTIIAPGTHAATGKATPVDADELPLVDSGASNILKKLTWANLKATLKTYLDTLYVALAGDQTISGIKTFSSGAVITGVTDGSSAAAGKVGEVLQVNVTGVSISTSLAQMTSLSLTAGDWDITAVGEYAGSGSETGVQICLNTTTASISGQVRGLGIGDAAVVQGAGCVTLRRRISISGTTTYYLNAVTNVTTGNYFYGSIIASRVR